MVWRRGWNTGSGKYGNKKAEIDGETFDSLKEARRGKELELMEQAGEIKNLRRQVNYLLIPAQREPDTIGPRGGVKKGKGVFYVADFVYTDADGNTVVEDVKGYRDTNSAAYKVFVLKRKMMLFKYGIRVIEI